jgi:hypothetical protein
MAGVLRCNSPGRISRFRSGNETVRVDPLVSRAEKLTLVLEAIGDDKVRVNSASLDNPLILLTDEQARYSSLAFAARSRCNALARLVAIRFERLGQQTNLCRLVAAVTASASWRSAGRK